jgi:hypothetical protein
LHSLPGVVLHISIIRTTTFISYNQVLFFGYPIIFAKTILVIY